jgi:hypothetical protein
MRRVIAAAVTGGLVLGGALTSPAFASAHNPGQAAKKPATAGRAKQAASSSSATKTVVFDQYEFQVPASWPVYRLDENPQTCVRYDVHAVYLGTPGAGMQCPAGLIGRSETVSFIPGHSSASAARAGAASLAGADVTQVKRLAAVHSTITQDATEGEMQVALSGSPTATVTGTYASDPGLVKQVLSTLRKAPSGSKSTAQSAVAQPPSARNDAPVKAKSAKSAKSAKTKPAKTKPAKAGTTAARTAPGQKSAPRPDPAPAATAGAQAAAPAAPAAVQTPVPNPTYSSWRGVPSNWPVQIVTTPTPKPPPVVVPPSSPPVVVKPSAPVNGFDTCTAPSLAAMQAWRSEYSAIGIYLGGANAACAHGNLSANWVTSAAAMGYGMLPTYVGRQAPCWDGHGLPISAASAATQGESAGADAVGQAKALGIAAGSPIYYDMEAYKGSASCTTAVLNFLGAWDRRVTQAGYVTGVYSSALSGIQDIRAAATAKATGFTVPTALWIALWDNKASLSFGSLAWPQADVNKQYQGNVTQSIGGYSLNIDQDIVGGPVAR